MKLSSERGILGLLAIVQFAHIMDFMILMPLGPQLMRELNIGPATFSTMVAAYTISAGLVGIAVAPFLDRFDRRSTLLVVFGGFALGTLACGLSKTAAALLVARGVCGAFGGVSSANVMAIVGDVVPPQRRAAAIGIIMTAFSVAAALGVPFGLYLAQHLAWEAPFLVLAGLSALTWMIAWKVLPHVRGHLTPEPRRRFHAFIELLKDPNAGRALLFIGSLVVGHFALIPLLSPYLVANVGMPESQLFLIYLVGGTLTAFTSPIVGKLADRLGHLRVYAVLVAVACTVMVILSHSGPRPTWYILILTGLFFVFASGRFVPAQALLTMAVPASRRGAFMSLSGCARDLASGLTSSIGAWVVTRGPTGRLVHYDLLGWLAVGMSLVSLWVGSFVRSKDVVRTIEPVMEQVG